MSPPQIPLRPRTVGQLVGLTLRLSLAHFPMLFGIVAVLLLPQLCLDLGLHHTFGDDGALGRSTAIGVMVATPFLRTLAAAIATVLVAASFTGQHVHLGAGIALALRRFFPLLGFSLLYTIGVCVGLVLLILPGIDAFLRYFVGSTAMVVDDASIRRAFRTSGRLARGGIMPIARFVGLIIVISVVPYFVALLAFMILGESVDERIGASVTWLVDVITSIPAAIAPVVLYFDLRVRHDALDVQQLADLVDRIGRRDPAAAAG